jgi:hypothetical protein
MRRLDLVLLIALATSPALAQSVSPSPAPPAAVEVPPPPAFKAGASVVDRNGGAIGRIKALAESDKGPMVVLEIDSKLVSVPQSSLKLQGEVAVSAQTKAQILATANAPR